MTKSNVQKKKEAALIGLLSATLGLEHMQSALPKGLLESKAEKFNAIVDDISPRERRAILTELLAEQLQQF